MWNNYNENSEYFWTLDKTEYVLLAHLSNGTQLPAGKRFCSAVLNLLKRGYFFPLIIKEPSDSQLRVGHCGPLKSG